MGKHLRNTLLVVIASLSGLTTGWLMDGDFSTRFWLMVLFTSAYAIGIEEGMSIG